MEEDIKLVEEFIKCNNIFIQIDELKRHSVNIAIENLIKGYRELKERNIYLVNERKKLEELLFMSNENYIEKSKIREKIEELKYENFKTIENRHRMDYRNFIEKIKRLDIQIGILEILILNPECKWYENGQELLEEEV